ncbi:phage replisome organizer N-terminal domain-containing protein [Enterococcus sp. HMSC072H05]|uniref:phage replisome organizer N-terminal domain-containing protein n=1 Tax=Enterococcus sp. HMSC072H05 TaxID=1715012 RepID=UPI0008A56E7A|nr:phage replisome organizer N-terminal domain-containing protein [Enterococcus sp. HMSC072H05]OFL87290.1 hypothetical protein HMPREF2742_17020 [Enterococcus sp. HMSC072H05]
MADINWIKLSTGLPDNRKIKRIRKLPDGDNVILFWVFLLARAGESNKSGGVFLTDTLPYTPEDLAADFDFTVEFVKFAILTLEKYSMITRYDDVLFIKNWEEYQSIEGMEKVREQNRIRQAEFRERQKQLTLSNVTNNVTSNAQVTQSNATDIELDIETDIELKNIYKDRFETIWKMYPKKTQKKKAFEQFKKKVKKESDLTEFEKGYFDYLKYIEITDWYHPQELFRWIRDERYKDEYDLAPKVSKSNYRNSKYRVEEVPSHIKTRPNKKESEIDWVAEAERSLAERGAEGE